MTIKEGYNRIEVKIKKSGQGKAYLFDLVQDYSCCDELDYGITMKHNKGKMDHPSCPTCTDNLRMDLEVSGGCPPYIWTVAGGTFVFDFPSTEEPSNYIRVDNYDVSSDPEGDLVTVTDACGTAVTCLIRTCYICDEDYENGGTPPGGGIPGQCADEDYVTPTIELINEYQTYAFIVVPKSIIYRGDGGKDYYIDHELGLGRIGTDELTNAQTQALYDASGNFIWGTFTVEKFNDEYDIIRFPSVIINLALGSTYTAVTTLRLCSCGGSGTFKISDGVEPYDVMVQEGSGWVTLHNKFFGDAYAWLSAAADCSGAYRTKVIDACDIESNVIDLGNEAPTAYGSIWTDGRDWITETTKACNQVTNFTFQLAFEYGRPECVQDIYFEGDERNQGVLNVVYATRTITCEDGISGSSEREVTYPVSATWVAGGGACCPSAADYVYLYVCAPGSSNRVLLDSVKINVVGATNMEWAIVPTSIAPGNQDTLFRVTGCTGNTVWTIEDVDGNGITWENAVRSCTSGTAQNDLNATLGACGTVKVVVTDNCGSISAYVQCTNGAYKPYCDWDADGESCTDLVKDIFWGSEAADGGAGLQNRFLSSGDYGGDSAWIEAYRGWRAKETMYNNSVAYYGAHPSWEEMCVNRLQWDDQIAAGTHRDFESRDRNSTFTGLTATIFSNMIDTVNGRVGCSAFFYTGWSMQDSDGLVYPWGRASCCRNYTSRVAAVTYVVSQVTLEIWGCP